MDLMKSMDLGKDQNEKADNTMYDSISTPLS